MKVLVTGATGFLGRHLVEALCGAGHEVSALVRREALRLERAGATLFRGDVLCPETLAPAIAGAEAVIHLAGRVQHKGEPTGLYELHVEGTRNMLAAAEEAKVGRFLHLSTSGTLAVSREEQVFDERAPYALEVARRWPYYLSKIYAEKVALDAHARGAVPVVVLSPSLLLGPLLSPVLASSRAGLEEEVLASCGPVLRFLRQEIPAVPPGGLNFVDVRDVAATCVRALSEGRAGERYLLGGPNMSVDAFFVLLSKISGIRAPSLRAPVRANRAASRAIEALEDVGGLEGDESVAYSMGGHFWYLDARKASRELGFKARSPEHTLRDTVAWIRSQGPLPASRGTLGSLVRGLQRAVGRI